MKTARGDVDFNSPDFGNYSSFLSGNYIPNGYLIRKTVLDKIPKFTQEAPLEDYFLHLQLSKYGKYKYIDKILFSYRWHGSNSVKNQEKMQQYTVKTLEYEYNFIQKSNKISKPSKEASEVIKFGFLYQSLGVPFIFEIKKYKDRYGNKQKYLSVFGLEIKI